MESDTIRASGPSTLVDLWVVDRVRPICVTREAIAAHVGFEEAESMTEDDRCRFVRDNLPLVLKAARTVLEVSGPRDGIIVLDGSALVGAGTAGGERRTVDRRKSERRRVSRPEANLPQGDRRRTNRRQDDRRRRARPKKPE